MKRNKLKKRNCPAVCSKCGYEWNSKCSEYDKGIEEGKKIAIEKIIHYPDEFFMEAETEEDIKELKEDLIKEIEK